MRHQLQQQAADAATGISAAGAGVAWLEVTQGYVDLLAGLVAIIAGIFAIAHYYRQWKRGRHASTKNIQPGAAKQRSPGAADMGEDK